MPWLRWLSALCTCLALSLSVRQTALLHASSGQSTPPPSAQSPQLIPRTQEERNRGYDAAHRIVLNVGVFDASGKAIPELIQTNFTLFKDHQPEKIARFRSVPGGSAVPPAHIVLVLDTVNNSASKLGYFRREIERYLAEGDGLLANPISIALFSDSGVRVGEASRNRNTVLEELKGLAGSLRTMDCAGAVDGEKSYLSATSRLAPVDPNPQLDCLNRRFNESVAALASLAQQQANVPVRVILIWIGQGWPLLSDNEFVPDTPATKASFFGNLVEISSALTGAQVMLDAIASPDLSSGKKAVHAHWNAFFNGVASESQVTAASLGLHALAQQSGGVVLTDTRDIAGEITACVADAASYYVLAFDSPPAAAFGEYHPLEVKIDKPDLTIRTRTFYYAEP